MEVPSEQIFVLMGDSAGGPEAKYALVSAVGEVPPFPPPHQCRRHCAYCLGCISPSAVKICGKCGRRAYCSPQCQKLDWSCKIITGDQQRGQCHKNWCGVEYGEEDVDWQVMPIAGKGLGIIALRPIAANTRIMVEAGQPNSRCHPKTYTLMPDGPNLVEKFLLNCLPVSCDPGENDFAAVLCLRMARLNHACNPNAGHFYDLHFRVMILYSTRDIEAGEEICISYTHYNNPFADKKLLSMGAHKALLEKKWGFKCTVENCICRDYTYVKKIEKAKELDKKIMEDCGFDASGIYGALKNGKELLELIDDLGMNAIGRMRTNYEQFQIALTKKRYLKQAKEFLEKANALYEPLAHPDATLLQQFKRYKQNLSTHIHYLRFDRR